MTKKEQEAIKKFNRTLTQAGDKADELRRELRAISTTINGFASCNDEHLILDILKIYATDTTKTDMLIKYVNLKKCEAQRETLIFFLDCMQGGDK